MNKRTSPPVRSAPRPALAVSTTDAVALVYLLGEAIAPPDELSSKRERVMAGLCQLVGADGWAIWLENESGCHSVFLRSTLESTESAGAEPHLPSCDVAASHFPHPGKVIIGSFGPLLVHRQSADGLALGIFRKSPGTSFSPREERLVRMVLEEVPWLSDLTPASGDLHWPLLPPRQ